MKLPPYAKPLQDLQKQFLKPANTINLFIGNKAWNKGQNFSYSYPTRTLILPPWLSPFIYYWPVKQCDILIVDTGFADMEYVDSLSSCLYQYDASIVRSINPDYLLTVHHKEM